VGEETTLVGHTSTYKNNRVEKKQGKVEQARAGGTESEGIACCMKLFLCVCVCVRVCAHMCTGIGVWYRQLVVPVP
jgi:hypothetical protein